VAFKRPILDYPKEKRPVLSPIVVVLRKRCVT